MLPIVKKFLYEFADAAIACYKINGLTWNATPPTGETHFSLLHKESEQTCL